MLSTQERCKCAVLEIAANGKEVVVFREVRLFALRSGGRRGCAGGVNGHPNSSNSDGHCFASHFLRLLVLCFWDKRMEIRKGEMHFYVSLGNLFGLFTK